MSSVQDYPHIENLPEEIDGIPVRETIRAIFRNPENGTPDDISKAGCLALALKSNEVGDRVGKGYVVWNAWREVFPARVVTANKSFIFENCADFSDQDFRSCTVNFSYFKFSHGANFEGTKCAEYATYEGVHWGVHANFLGARWGRGANLNLTYWAGNSSFRGAFFEANASFGGAYFGPGCSFEGTQLGNGACFELTTWGPGINFRCADWDQLRNAFGSTSAWQSAKDLAVASGLEPCAFEQVDFAGAHFEGEVDFSNRQFKSSTNFGLADAEASMVFIQRDETGYLMRDAQGAVMFKRIALPPRWCTFNKAPLFHGCDLHQDTSFEGAQFPPDIRKTQGNEEAARAYRTLKLAFSEYQADSEEQRFFRLELAEKTMLHRINSSREFSSCSFWRAGREIGLWLLYKFYQLTSSYGSSVIRPLLIWLVLAVISSGLYADLSCEETCFLWTQNCSLDSKAFGRSLFQAVPFGGLTELKDNTYEWWHSAGIVLHKAFSLVLLFLIGLALRNLFKLK